MASDAHDPLEPRDKPRDKPRVRAVFIGNAALEALRALGGDGSVVEGERCAFHISQPDGASAEWARGVDVVVLGATHERRRTVLMHAAAAGVAHVVLLSADDDAERRHREMCADIGLDGDAAVVVKEPAHLLDMMDRIVAQRASSAIAAGVVTRTQRERDGWRFDVRAIVLRGALRTPSGEPMHMFLLASGAWHPCVLQRVERRAYVAATGSAAQHTSTAGDVDVDAEMDLEAAAMNLLQADMDVGVGVGEDVIDGFMPNVDASFDEDTEESAPPDVGFAAAGDHAALEVVCAHLPFESDGADVLICDEPLPLTSEVPLEDALEPPLGGLREPRVFLGWIIATASIDGNRLRFDRAQPAPPSRRYWVLRGI